MGFCANGISHALLSRLPLCFLSFFVFSLSLFLSSFSLFLSFCFFSFFSFSFFSFSFFSFSFFSFSFFSGLLSLSWSLLSLLFPGPFFFFFFLCLCKPEEDSFSSSSFSLPFAISTFLFLVLGVDLKQGQEEGQHRQAIVGVCRFDDACGLGWSCRPPAVTATMAAASGAMGVAGIGVLWSESPASNGEGPGSVLDGPGCWGGGDEEEDDPFFEEDLQDEYRRSNFDVWTLLQWLSLVLIIRAVACTLSIRV